MLNNKKYSLFHINTAVRTTVEVVQFLSFKISKNRCHLKNKDGPTGRIEDFNYISAARCCDDDDCLKRVSREIPNSKISNPIKLYTGPNAGLLKESACDNLLRIVVLLKEVISLF